MELKDTIDMMTSDDFKERFRAEYFQTKIRYDKLDEMTVCYEAGTLPFTPNCSLELLKEQKKHMGNYIRCLKIRAQIENIDLREDEVEQADKKALKAFIDKVKGLDSSKYKENTWTPFEKTLDEAIEVYENKKATQVQVDNAYNELVKAFLSLRLIPNKDLI